MKTIAALVGFFCMIAIRDIMDWASPFIAIVEVGP
jgi:hypothetical protein